MKEDSASWYEQVRYRRERENKHWPRRMKLRARRSHVYSNAGGGRWRGSGVRQYSRLQRGYHERFAKTRSAASEIPTTTRSLKR